MVAVSAGKRNELTPHQKELLVLLGQGMRAKEIAFKWNHTISSVNGQIAQIHKKLGTTSLAEAVLIAFKEGFIPDPDQLDPTPKILKRANLEGQFILGYLLKLLLIAVRNYTPETDYWTTFATELLEKERNLKDNL